MPNKKQQPPLPEQLRGEGDLAYSLACEYFQLGPKRSIRALAELTGRSRPSLGQLSVDWLWPGRAAAWDRLCAIAPEPEESRVEILGDRRAKIEAALDGLIDLVRDKINSADPIDTSSRSIASLVNSLKACLEIERDLNPDLGAQFKAMETLIGRLHPRVLDALSEHTQLFIDVAKGNLDATISTLDPDFGDKHPQDFLEKIKTIADPTSQT